MPFHRNVVYNAKLSWKLPKYGDFEVARVMVLEDLYSHIVPITAKEGKIKYGLAEDLFCDTRRQIMYDLSKRETSMLTQLSKLTNFSNFEMQQVSETWKVQLFDAFVFTLTKLCQIEIDPTARVDTFLQYPEMRIFFELI